MKRYHTYQIAPEHAGLTVEQYLKQIAGYSGRSLQKLTRCKGILLQQRPAFLQRTLSANASLRVLQPADTDYGVLPEQGAVHVLYEDDYLIVLDKPPRQLVHPTGQTSRGTLANYLAAYWQSKQETITIRPLHRLDRDTSGCVMLAKTAASQYQLEQQLKSGQLKRLYLAVASGALQPPSGSIDAPIGPHPQLANRRAVRPNGDAALTHYQVLHAAPAASLLRLELTTGRTHQIRVHLAHAGHPLLGDAMYGSRSPLISRQALHAWQMHWLHPVSGEPQSVTAPLPADWQRLLTVCELTLPN